jgi:hypothetical protein
MNFICIIDSFNLMQKNISRQKKKLILTRAWYIWWERRQFTHGEDIQPVYRSAMSSRRYG